VAQQGGGTDADRSGLARLREEVRQLRGEKRGRWHTALAITLPLLSIALLALGIWAARSHRRGLIGTRQAVPAAPRPRAGT
jgi:hypothetical protein